MVLVLVPRSVFRSAGALALLFSCSAESAPTTPRVAPAPVLAGAEPGEKPVVPAELRDASVVSRVAIDAEAVAVASDDGDGGDDGDDAFVDPATLVPDLLLDIRY